MQSDELCCGNSTSNATKYKVAEQICCEDTIVFDVVGEETDYYNDEYMCCQGQHLWPVSDQLVVCCGGSPYDMESQGCCENVIYETNTQNCCNGEVYLNETQYCCTDRLFLIANMIGDIYYSEEWMCCQQIYPRLRYTYDACCQDMPYTRETHRCCADGSVEERPFTASSSQTGEPSSSSSSSSSSSGYPC